MQTFKFLEITLFICLFHQTIGEETTNPCKDWDIIIDNKCFKVIESSLKSCKSLSTTATLASTETLREQEILDKYLFKNQSIVDNVWIGAKKENISSEKSGFVWDNGSKMNFKIGTKIIIKKLVTIALNYNPVFTIV
jgi:hypothetical protein